MAYTNFDHGGPISGIYALAMVGTGSANLIQQLGKWSVNPKAESSEVAHSGTRQAMDRVAGNDDWDGNYLAYGDTPLVFPGGYFDFTGTMDGTYLENSPLTGTIGYSGHAIADEFSMKIDTEGAKEIFHEVKFSGAVTPGQAATTCLTASTAYSVGPVGTASSARPIWSAVGCRAFYCTPATCSTSTTWLEIPDVRSMDLSIKAANKAYNSSGTLGHTGRLPGPLDVTVGINIYAQNLYGFVGGVVNHLPQEHDVIAVRLETMNPVSANSAIGRYWLIAWLVVGQKSNIEVDRKSGNLVGCTINAGFKATSSYSPTPSDINTGGSIGIILDPNGVHRWGVINEATLRGFSVT